MSVREFARVDHAYEAQTPAQGFRDGFIQEEVTSLADMMELDGGDGGGGVGKGGTGYPSTVYPSTKVSVSCARTRRVGLMWT